MPAPEIGILGLPTKFASGDPALRAEQYQHAISVGYERFRQRVRKFTFRTWEPTDSTLRIFEDPEDFITEIISRNPRTIQDPSHDQDHQTSLRQRPPQAWSDYERGEILFNLSLIRTPLQLAVVTAHETGHLTGKVNPVSFRSSAAITEAADMREVIENAACEGLVQYSALEVTGLLNTPLTRLAVDPTLLKEAVRFMTLKQFASAFGSNFTDKMFQIAQGTLPPADKAALDAKMGKHSINPGWTSFYDRGILFPAALTQHPDWEEGLPFSRRTSTQVAAWFQRVRGNKLEFMQRPDVIEANRLILNPQSSQTA